MFDLILYLVRDVRPVLFFTSIVALLLITAMVLGFPLLLTFRQTGLVPPLPTAVLATGLVLLSSLSLRCGLIVDSVVMDASRKSNWPILPTIGADSEVIVAQSRRLPICTCLVPPPPCVADQAHSYALASLNDPALK